MSTSEALSGGAQGATAAPSATPSAIPVTPQGQSTGAVQAAPIASNAQPSWKQDFNEDLRGYLDNKGFKGPQDLAEAYRNFEKLQGVPQDKILKLSGEMYDKEGKLTPDGKAIWEKMGAGKEAGDYKLPMPEGGDPEVSKAWAGFFAENGVPKSMAEKIVGRFNEASLANDAAQKSAYAAQVKQQDAELRQEWGNAYEQNKNIASEAVRTMGITADKIDAIAVALGHAETIKLFQKLGRSVGESTFISGASAGGVMEPAQAQTQIRSLRDDAGFRTKLINGDTEAKTKWDNLHKQAYPG